MDKMAWVHTCQARDLYEKSEYDGPVDLIYMDPPFFTQRDFGEFEDKWESLDQYVDSIMTSVRYLAPFMNNTNFVIHIDPRTSHYLKVALDGLFGYDSFVNEIIWAYNSGGASKKKLPSKHDVMLVYKIGKAPFNVLREPYATPNVQDRPGFHPDGRMVTDVWNMSIMSTTSKERVGYPTQKPSALLERVVSIFSDEGGVVVDPYCGSGTTAVAALTLNRSFVGCDTNPSATELTMTRLEPLFA